MEITLAHLNDIHNKENESRLNLSDTFYHSIPEFLPKDIDAQKTTIILFFVLCACEELYLSTYRQNRLGYPRIFRPQTHRKQHMKSFTICTSYTIMDNGTRRWTGFIWLRKRFNGLLLWTQCCTFGGREYLNQLGKYYPLNKDSAPSGLLYNFFSIHKCMFFSD